jgi:hypothetical protein
MMHGQKNIKLEVLLIHRAQILRQYSTIYYKTIQNYIAVRH